MLKTTSFICLLFFMCFFNSCSNESAYERLITGHHSGELNFYTCEAPRQVFNTKNVDIEIEHLDGHKVRIHIFENQALFFSFSAQMRDELHFDIIPFVKDGHPYEGFGEFYDKLRIVFMDDCIVENTPAAAIIYQELN